MMEEESQQQANARETIGDRLMAFNFSRDYIRELGNFKPINTASGEVKTAKDILEKALNDYKLKKLARYKLGGIITLKQKLGLEGRLFSADNNRTEMPVNAGTVTKINSLVRGFLGRRKAKKEAWIKHMQVVGRRIGQRKAGSVIAASMKRALAQRSMGIAGHINRMATTLPTLQLVADTTSSPTVARAATVVANDIVGRSGNYKPPMGAKGTQERANYMAWLRAERKGGRRTKKQISQANLIKRARFGLPRAYQGRPSSAVAPAPAPTVVPASAAPSRNISALLNRARFGKARRYPGRPRKVATVASLPNAIVASAAPKKRGRPRKVVSVAGGMMSIPRAVSTGNGAVARRGRPRTLTSDTARLVRDVQRLRGKGKSVKSIAFGVLTGSKGTAGKRGRPGIVVSDAGRIVKDVLKLRGIKRR